MAIYVLHVKTFGRARGGRVTRAAAYRAGERIRDERTREVYNFSDRQDVAHKEIVLPSEYAGRADMDWARDRSKLWNAAEHAGGRRNARLGREVLVVLPPELTPAQRTRLVRRFSQELADKYHNAVDATIHPPRPGADERHHHAHLLMTARQVTPVGLGARTTLELSGTERHALGLGPSKEDLLQTRERWAQVTNEALREAGLDGRVDHRGFKARGVDREPVPLIPQKILYLERRSGVATQAGDEIRARHRERVEARLKGGDELARVLRKQKEEGRRRAIERAKDKEALPKKISWSALTREELNERRRNLYAAKREILNQKRRERYRENAVVIREKRREVRQRKAQELREQRAREGKANAGGADKRGIEYSRGNTTAQQSVQRWLKLREQRREAVTRAQERTPAAQRAPEPTSAGRKEATDNQLSRSSTAAESVDKWLALREARKQADVSRTAAEEPSHDSGIGAKADDDDDDDPRRKTNRSRDNDYEL